VKLRPYHCPDDYRQQPEPACSRDAGKATPLHHLPPYFGPDRPSSVPPDLPCLHSFLSGYGWQPDPALCASQPRPAEAEYAPAPPRRTKPGIRAPALPEPGLLTGTGGQQLHHQSVGQHSGSVPSRSVPGGFPLPVPHFLAAVGAARQQGEFLPEPKPEPIRPCADHQPAIGRFQTMRNDQLRPINSLPAEPEKQPPTSHPVQQDSRHHLLVLVSPDAAVAEPAGHPAVSAESPAVELADLWIPASGQPFCFLLTGRPVNPNCHQPHSGPLCQYFHCPAPSPWQTAALQLKHQPQHHPPGIPQSGAQRFGAQRFGAQRFEAQRFEAQRFESQRFGAQRFGALQFGTQKSEAQQSVVQQFGPGSAPVAQCRPPQSRLSPRPAHCLPGIPRRTPSPEVATPSNRERLPPAANQTQEQRHPASYRLPVARLCLLLPALPPAVELAKSH